MEIIDNKLTLIDKKSLLKISSILNFDINKTAFFDIETTGLSREYSMLYLAGFVYFENSDWSYRQFFAEDEDDEFRTLLACREFMKKFSLIISFNGESFDIPFLKARYDKYGINADFPESFDIYKKVRPFKKLLGLENLKQKSIEKFLGIYREDKMSGGELIDVYYDYAENHGEKERSLLLLHNADDIAGMPEILEIFSYLSIFMNEIQDIGHSLSQYGLTLTIPLGKNVTHKKSFHIDSIELDFDGSNAEIFIPYRNCELRHFFKDYKNYYYIPESDSVIHRSVGQYMDPGQREKATASNCYVKKDGAFLPQFKTEVFSPSFREDHKSKEYYFLPDEKLFDKDSLRKYCSVILSNLQKLA